MRGVHKKTHEEAKSVRCQFSLRKRKNSVLKPKRKRLYLRKQCAVTGCHCCVVRMENHLTGVHKLSTNSSEYRMFLREAQVVLEEDTIKIAKIDVSVSSDSDIEEPALVEPELVEPELVEPALIDFNKVCYNSEEDEDFLLDSEDDELQESEQGDSEDESSVGGDVTQNADYIDSTSTEVVNKNTEFIMEEFGKWMESADGGKKKVDGVEQQIKQALKVIHYVDPKHADVSAVMNRNDVRNKWLTPFQNELMKDGKKRKPGTIRSYLNSLRLLTEFLEISKIDSRLKSDDIRAIQTQAKAWCRGMRKESKKREYVKIYEDHDRITTPDEVKEFENSTVCREAVGIIGKFSLIKPGIVPTQKEYTHCRDYLLWQLSIDNGGRPGQFMEITLHNFDTATYRGDQRIINVFEHKTAETHGPARVVFSKCLYNYFKIFISNIRGKMYGFATGKDSFIFLTATGNPMSSKNVSGRLTALWGRGLKGKFNSRMNNTIIRKSIQTFVRREHSHMKEKVSDKLLHHEKTAEKYYNVIRKGEEAADTSKFIAEAFKGVPVSTTPLEDIGSSVKVDAEDNLRWSDENTELLNKMFSDVEDITMDVVKTKLNASDSCLISFRHCPKKVLDKLRYLRKTQPHQLQSIEELPNETMTEKMERSGIDIEDVR